MKGVIQVFLVLGEGYLQENYTHSEYEDALDLMEDGPLGIHKIQYEDNPSRTPENIQTNYS